jgi:hypothetical protein
LNTFIDNGVSKDACITRLDCSTKDNGRDIEEQASNAVFPSVILQPDLLAVSDDGGAKAEYVFWQVASGHNPNTVDIARAPDPDLVPRPVKPEREQKYEGRMVFRGNNAVDEDWDIALFQELGSAPTTMMAAKTCDLYGLLEGPDPDHNSSTSFRTHLVRDFSRRGKLRCRLWTGSWTCVRCGRGLRNVP